jgi:hypothetical protein
MEARRKKKGTAAGRRSARLRPVLALVVTAALAASLAACSDDDPDQTAQPEITTPSTSSSTTDPPAGTSSSTTAPEDERVEADPPPDEPRPDIDVNVTYPATFTPEQVEVVEAYRGYWHAYYLARDPCGPTPVGTPPQCPTNPDAAVLAQYATGARLDALRANLDVRSDTVSFIPPDGVYRHDIADVTLNEVGAVITACSVDDAVVLSAATGEVVNDEVFTTRMQATLTQESDHWFVTGESMAVLEEWSGDEGEQCLADF